MTKIVTQQIYHSVRRTTNKTIYPPSAKNESASIRNGRLSSWISTGVNQIYMWNACYKRMLLFMLCAHLCWSIKLGNWYNYFLAFFLLFIGQFHFCEYLLDIFFFILDTNVYVWVYKVCKNLSYIQIDSIDYGIC